MKKDKKDKKRVLYLGQKENMKYFNINDYFNGANILTKYPKKDILNDYKENNYYNPQSEKIYDLMGNKGFLEFIKNKEWIIPLDEKEENNKNIKKEKNDFAYIHSNLSDDFMNEGLFKNLFC